MNAAIQNLFRAVEAWPPEDQDELAEIARDIEARRRGAYVADAEEAAGIRRGLEAARQGRFASEDEVEAVRAMFRHE